MQLFLRFTPHGTREEHLHAGLLTSDFVQPYGVFEGHVDVRPAHSKTTTRYEIKDVYGVVEKHYAKW